MHTILKRIPRTTASVEIASEWAVAEYIGYDAIDPDATADDVGRLTVLAAGPVGIDLALAQGYCLDEPWTDHDIDAHYSWT